jgi:hypothetical protein
VKAVRYLLLVDITKGPLLNFEWIKKHNFGLRCCYVVPVELWAGRSAVHNSTGCRFAG